MPGVIELTKEEKEVVIQMHAPFRKDLLKFFLEMTTNWLIPGKTLYLSEFHSVRENNSLQCRANILVSSEGEAEQILENFAHLEEEIKWGIRSSYHAKKLLELKGLFLDEKEGFVAEAIREKVFKFPKRFDYDVFQLMQKFLVAVSEEYKNARSYQMLSRIIATSYLISERVKNEMAIFSDRRHFYLKLIPIKISTPFGEKLILGCFFGMNFLKDNEILEEKHLLRAVRKYCPDVSLVEGSLFVQKEQESLIFYTELEAEDSFSFEEISLLKKELKEQVKGSIESLVRPVFMPRNEEEVMKYMVTLSKQVTHYKDIPHIVIIFNEQTDQHLIFTLVMVRPIADESVPLQNILQSDDFEVYIEKVRSAGYIRKNIFKEASQVRISVKKTEFLREDFVVDLYQARQAIVTWLEKYLGAIRDYNGGMISRQLEIFLALQEKFSRNDRLLSHFFHSLHPIELRASVSIDCLQEFYQLVCHWFESDQDFSVKEGEEVLYLCMKEKNDILESITQFRCLQLKLRFQDRAILGFVLFPNSVEEKKRFLEVAGCLS